MSTPSQPPSQPPLLFDLRPINECLRCTYIWRQSDINIRSRSCPRCGSAYWDTPPRRRTARKPGDAPNPRWRQRRRELWQQYVEKDPTYRDPKPMAGIPRNYILDPYVPKTAPTSAPASAPTQASTSAVIPAPAAPPPAAPQARSGLPPPPPRVELRLPPPPPPLPRSVPSSTSTWTEEHIEFVPAAPAVPADLAVAPAPVTLADIVDAEFPEPEAEMELAAIKGEDE